MTLDSRQEEQVHKAFGALADSAPLGVEFDELISHGGTLSLSPAVSAHAPRGWLVGVAGAIGVLLFGFLAVLTQQTTPDSTTGSTVTPVQGLSEWSRISDNEDVLGGEGTQWIESVAAGGPGFVAVGWDGVGIYENTAALWTSVDGVSWVRITRDGSPFGGGFVSDVAAGGPGLVAVGEGEAYTDEAGTAVWTSVDGVSWVRVPYDAMLAEGEGEMISVTAGGPGLVAVGTDGGDAAVWTSVDGITWSRVPHDEATFGGTTHQTMLSVTSGGPGLVAVGEGSRDDNRDARTASVAVAAVWTSPDGFTWSRVPHDESVFGGSGVLAMESIASGAHGLVAVGRDAKGAGVWSSSDGFTWSRIPDDAATEQGAMLSVAATEAGYVAVGWAGAGAAIWESPDGITWSRISTTASIFGGEGIQRINDLAIGAGGLVAVGSDGFPENGDAAIWFLDK